VLVDGVRLADGAPGDPQDAPTALSGLSVTWGRETTVDQPAPSSCAFTVADDPGGTSFADVLHVGSLVEVLAAGTVYPDPSESTFTDPGFEAAAPNATGAVNLTVARSTRRAHAGVAAAALKVADRLKRGSVILAPAPFAAPGTDPGAWDAIPTTLPGQRWSLGASLFVPPGAAVRLRPALFTGPYAAAGHVLDVPGITVTGDPTTPTWRVVSGIVVPDVAGAWVGLAVEVWPTGLRWDQVPRTTTWTSLGASSPGWTWDDAGMVYLDDVLVAAPAAGTESTVLVFTGRVTDLVSSYDESIPAPVLKVTALDFTADLDNIDVGDQPWPAEGMSARFARILGLSMPAVPAQIDPSLAAIPVSWRDVDRQSAAGLLAELATSVDGILWSATHRVSGPYLRVEDPAARPPAAVLALEGAVVRVVTAAAAELVLSACDLLLAPITWTQAVADITTRVAVTWLEEGLDEAGLTITTERTYTLIDTDRESAWGVRALSLSTQLRAQADATAVAAAILARTGLGWRADGATLDDDFADTDDDDPTLQVTRFLTLLDGTTRNGLLLQFADLPAWAPGAPAANVYLEGGTYTFDEGRWVLDLTVSAGTGTGASATWDDLDPTWAWNEFDPAITWDDLRGVGVSEETT
jgi:hypothetical protein